MRDTIKFGLAALALSGAVAGILWSYDLRQKANAQVRLEECVNNGMRYRLSKEDESLREIDILRGIYLTGQLPPAQVSVIPLDLPELALRKGQEARAQVIVECRRDSQSYHL